MLSCQSLNPNTCGRASRSGWMGEAKRRNLGDRKRAESSTKGHNTLLVCSSCYCCDPYIQHPKIPNDDAYLRSASAWEGHGVTNKAPRMAHCTTTRRRRITTSLRSVLRASNIFWPFFQTQPDLLRDLFLVVCDRSAERLDLFIGVCDRSSARFIR